MTIFIASLFGLAFGSFANAAIDRLPRGASLFGRSHCDACDRTLGLTELVPLLSFVVLQGRCAGCGVSIGLRTPFVEATTALVFAAAFAGLPAVGAACAAGACVLVLVAAGVAAARRETAS
jgi:prepilin signal peptidase PulO-like enzyme (type II secretory pathway)